MSKFSLTEAQKKHSGKYFLDLSRIMFSVLVVGLLASGSLRVAISLDVWYIGITGSIILYITGMYFLGKVKR